MTVVVLTILLYIVHSLYILLRTFQAPHIMILLGCPVLVWSKVLEGEDFAALDAILANDASLAAAFLASCHLSVLLYSQSKWTQGLVSNQRRSGNEADLNTDSPCNEEALKPLKPLRQSDKRNADRSLLPE